jgi:hypothetical protein
VSENDKFGVSDSRFGVSDSDLGSQNVRFGGSDLGWGLDEVPLYTIYTMDRHICSRFESGFRSVWGRVWEARGAHGSVVGGSGWGVSLGHLSASFSGPDLALFGVKFGHFLHVYRIWATR